MPAFNWTVMAATLAIVLGFRSSGALAAAFGLAVAGTMTITTVLFVVVARRRWGWPRPVIAVFLVVFLTIDLGFVNVWARGRRILRERLRARAFGLTEFLDSFGLEPCTRVPGTAVFLSSNPDVVPLALLHYLKHARSLHQQVILLSVIVEDESHVPAEERLEMAELQQGFWRVVGRYGFMQSPDVPALLARAGFDTRTPTYFLGREKVVSTRGRVRGWRDGLFSFMHHNERAAAEFFNLPPNQVMEVGAQVAL